MKFPSLKTGIFLVIILALLVIIVFREGEMRKKEDATIALVSVSAIRAGLTAYYAERGSYPKAERVAIGGNDARILCLSRGIGEQEGFLGDEIPCTGAVVYKSDGELQASQFIYYTSSGASYGVQFAIPAPLGAFTRPGSYCATEKGILIGECD